MAKRKFDGLIIVLAVTLMAFGVAFLLAGFNVIPIRIRKMWIPSVLVFAGVLLLYAAISNKDTFAGWFGALVLLLSAIVIIAEMTTAKYAQLYPLFIALPGIASAFIIPFTKARKPHIKSVIFFSGTALVFLLDVFGKVNWGIIIAVLLISAGTLLLVNALLKKNDSWERTEEERNMSSAQDKQNAEGQRNNSNE